MLYWLTIVAQHDAPQRRWILLNAQDVKERLIRGALLSREEASDLCDDRVDLLSLMVAANRVREHFFGRRVSFCSIINAKSGKCAGDCAFCAQSLRHAADIEAHPMMAKSELLEAIRQTAASGVRHVGIVTSGVESPQRAEMDVILDCVRHETGNGGSELCCSLGRIDEEQGRRLRQAGVTRYHHNLETSRDFYGNVSKYIDYDDRVQTVRAAKKAGLETCCGGIFGLGETWKDRIDLAMTIRELDVDSVPLNFLRPMKGTPMGNRPPLNPREALRIIALYRLILRDRTIRICGGREFVLRDLQSWMFHAGANGAMLGNYLTTTGRPPQEDLQMVEDLGLELC
jgi:biotin synthase